MATFEATTTPQTFAQMEGEVRTVWVVPRTPAFDGVSSGDRIEFDPIGSITVGAVRRYEDLRQLVETEGVQNVEPGAATVDEAIAALRADPAWSRAADASNGFIALRVRSTKRKA